MAETEGRLSQKPEPMEEEPTVSGGTRTGAGIEAKSTGTEARPPQRREHLGPHRNTGRVVILRGVDHESDDRPW